MCAEIVRCARASSPLRNPNQEECRIEKAVSVRAQFERGAPKGFYMDPPKLIITEHDGEAPMSGMCSACRAIFSTIEANGQEHPSIRESTR